MASTERDVSVELHVFGLPATRGIARVRERDPGERSVRALKGGGALFGLALLSIFIPIAHFVLVPGFLIAAVVFALSRMREDASIVALSGTCPRCQEERTFDAKGPFGPETKTTCPVCSFAIDVEVKAGASKP